jgi:O-succinylbenzoic acid--CoA ligase
MKWRMTNDETFWSSDDSHGLSDGAPLHLAPKGHVLVKTSGTEGKAKWVALSKRAFLLSAEAVNAHLESTAQDRWLIALPTHHVGGFSIYARAFVSGASVHHDEGKWDAVRFAQLCRNEHITLTSLVPTQVFDLVQQRLKAPESLQAIVVGGGGLSKEIGQQARALGWPVLQSYGMTETASQVATEPLLHLETGFDPDDLEVLPLWDVQTSAGGLLSIRGPALASGYVIDQAWHPIEQPLSTRDRVSLGTHSTRQYLRFIGRESQVLKIMGELVHLAALQAKLEALALKHGSTGRSVIVPVDDARRGHALVLVHEDGAAGVMTEFNAQVQPFERLERAVQLTRMPLSVPGKVRVAELGTMLAMQKEME